MSEFSARMAATALRLIDARGVDAVLQRNAQGDMNASGDRVSTPGDSPTRAVYLPQEGQIIVDGVERKWAQVLMPAVSPAPQARDHVQISAGINAGTYLINRAKNWAPEGGLIYSDLEVVL